MSREGEHAIEFVAALTLIGMGVGFLVDSVGAGALVGAGAGIALAGLLVKRGSNLMVRVSPLSVLLALVGLGMAFGGLSLLALPAYTLPAPYKLAAAIPLIAAGVALASSDILLSKLGR